RADRAGRFRCGHGPGRRRAGRGPAPQPGAPPRPVARRAAGGPAGAVPAVPVHPLARCACHRADRGVARRGTGLLMARRRQLADAETLEQLCSAKEIIVSTGSGGVGKTTTAAALAATAATNLGIKVLVLTVDPARRLANALGMEQFGNVETRVPPEAFVEAGVDPQGELWAAMLDTKQSWDDLIAQHAPDTET